MSNINPQSIDGTYPIAGQDNNSQGFRDNFTNTVNNFTFAAAELSDLQQNAVLKAALGSVGQTGTPTNDLNYAFLTHPQLKGAVETSALNLTVTAGTFVVNWESAHFQSVALTAATGDASFTFTNWPASGYFTKLRLQVTVSGGTRVLTFPSGVNINVSTIQGYTSGTSVSLANGVYVFEFSTVNFGANVVIQDVLRNYSSSAFTTLSATGTTTLSGNLVTGATHVEPGYQQVKPTANVAVAVSGLVNRVLIHPTGTIVSFGANVTLPNVQVDGTIINISSNVTIASLDVRSGWNGVVAVSPFGNVTNVTAGTNTRYMYIAADSIWYRVA